MSPQSILIGQIIVVLGMQRSGSPYSLTMMLISERDSQVLALTKFMPRGNCFSGGINLMLTRRISFPKVDRLRQAVDLAVSFLPSSARFGAGGLQKL